MVAECLFRDSLSACLLKRPCQIMRISSMLRVFCGLLSPSVDVALPVQTRGSGAAPPPPCTAPGAGPSAACTGSCVCQQQAPSSRAQPTLASRFCSQVLQLPLLSKEELPSISICDGTMCNWQRDLLPE